jgi:hypothetical protein
MQVDLMARGASIALFLLWSWVLFRDHRDMLAARIAVTMNVAIIAYVLTTSAWDFKPSIPRFFLSIFAGSTPGLFRLFARTWFNDRQRIETGSILLIALSVFNIAAMELSLERNHAINLITGILFRAGMLAFAIAGLRLGRKAAGLLALPLPADRCRWCNAKSRCCRTAAHAIINRCQKPQTQIHRQKLSHPCRPPAPAGILNHTMTPMGTPFDPMRSKNALMLSYG